MPDRLSVLRLLALWSMVFWLGGFTFYAAVVIPVLHDQLGSPLETGLVTRRVTDVLNAAGFVTIVLAWTLFRMEPERPSVRSARRRWSGAALAATTVCLLCLVLLHRVLDQMLDGGGLSGFYRLHRVYLWLSTIQWLANLILLTGWARAWRGGTGNQPAENFKFSGDR